VAPAGISTPPRTVSRVTTRNMPWAGAQSRKASSTTAAGVGPVPVGGDPGVLGRAGDKEAHRLGQEGGGGLVAGHEELVEDRQHLGRVEGPGVDRGRQVKPPSILQAVLVAVDGGLQQVGEEVVAGRAAPVVELGGEVRLELDQAPGGVEAALVGDVGADQVGGVVRPLAEGGLHVPRNPEGVGDHPDGQRHGELRHQLHGTAPGEGPDQLVAEPVDGRLPLTPPAGA